MFFAEFTQIYYDASILKQLQMCKCLYLKTNTGQILVKKILKISIDS